MTARTEELGGRLDAAERDAIASGELHDDFDFEDEHDVLHHDAMSCPWCRVRMFASDYRAAVRAVVIARREPKLKFRTSKDAAASYVACRHAYDAAHAAFDFYIASIDLGARERAIVDAAAAYERAEGDWHLMALQIQNYEREKSIVKAERRAGIVRIIPHRRSRVRVS